MTDYQKQAQDFLEETGTELKIEFLRHGKYWDDDKETRDVYEITLKRGRRSYTFTFGACLNDSCYRIKNANTGRITHSVSRDKVKFTGDTKKNSWAFRYALGHALGFPLFPGDIVLGPQAPTAYDVLACLEKYNPGTFEDFCANYGYDTDSRKAEKTYHAVMDQWLRLSTLYNEKEMEKLAEIQ